jgi:RHS repeat-associated protein
VKNGGTTVAAYSYDGQGWRITETHGSTTRDLYYSDNWQVLEERVGGVVQARNVWTPVNLDTLVLRDQSSAGNGTLDQRLYVQQDANGNVTALVDTSGNVLERYLYDAYGAVIVLTPTWGVRSSSAYNWVYLFQGERYDPTTGLYNFRNRDLSPSLMRWLQNDPEGFTAGDANLYRGEGNNPVNSQDPMGEEVQKVLGGTLSAGVKKGYGKDADQLLIKYKGRDAQKDGFYKVKQYMQLEVWAKYDCPGACKGVSHTRLVALRKGLNLADDELHHDHDHNTRDYDNPDVQTDHGKAGDFAFENAFINDLDDKTIRTYQDQPTALISFWAKARDLVKKELGTTRWFGSGRNRQKCTLKDVRVVQRFVTVVWLNNKPAWTVYWMATSSAQGPLSRGDTKGSQTEITILDQSEGGPKGANGANKYITDYRKKDEFKIGHCGWTEG